MGLGIEGVLSAMETIKNSEIPGEITQKEASDVKIQSDIPETPFEGSNPLELTDSDIIPDDIPDIPYEGKNPLEIEPVYDVAKDNSDGALENNEGLTDEEKAQIKEETGWSDEIIDHIENMKQYEIYKNAGLHEEIINGRHCLVKDIDWDYVDPKTGLTNRERVEKNLSPIDSKTGEKIELHHMGQDYDSPFAELCEKSEHGDGNHSVLHTKTTDSWRNDAELKNQYNNEDRPDHWKSRLENGG